MARKPSRHVGTLGDLARHGHTLSLNCEGCRHWSRLDLQRLIAAHGENYLVRRVVDRAICTACGDRDAAVNCTVGWEGAPDFSYPKPIEP